MPTTLETFAGKQAGNYCTMPKLDVEILPATRHCQTCDAAIVFDGNAGLFGQWTHLTGDGAHTALPRLQCHYCHAETGVTFVQAPYSDETRCTRCGGVDGFGIGD